MSLPLCVLLPLSQVAFAEQADIDTSNPYGIVEIGVPIINTQLIRYPSRTRPMPDMPRTPSVSMTSAGVVEIGEPDMNVPVINQSGNNKPLPDALRAILPKGWHAKKKPGVDRGLLISWHKGWDWVATLNDVAVEYRLAIAVDWSNQTVTVLNQDHYEQPAIPAREPNKVFTVTNTKWDEIKPKPAATKDNNMMPAKDNLIELLPEKPEKKIAEPIKAIAATSLPTSALPLPPPTKSAPALNLVSGQKMSQSLDTWAREIGWNLIWEAKVDYPVSVNTTFTGNTEEVITKFGDAVVHSHLPLHIDVYKQNRTVRISN